MSEIMLTGIEKELEEVFQEVQSRRGNMIYIDESHWICNSKFFGRSSDHLPDDELQLKN